MKLTKPAVPADPGSVAAAGLNGVALKCPRCPLAEERELYVQTVATFLARAEADGGLLRGG